MIVKPRNISGFADYTEAENAALSSWIRSIESIYRLYGFTRLIPRPVELREVLLSKGGIQKQIFGISRLQNDAPTDMALPFDRTVPLAYWVAKHQGEITFPYKRYDISYSYRGEHAQAGRFQGFFQADVDIIGQETLDNSAASETLNVIYNAIIGLGFKNIYFCLNELGLINNILKLFNISVENIREVLNIIDSIDKVTEEQFIGELQKVTLFTKEKTLEFKQLFCFTGSIDTFKSIIQNKQLYNEDIEKSICDVQEIVNFLIKNNVPEEDIIFRPAIVRGLDYYTGIVFETFVKGNEQLGSVASGGRYDNLASTFTKMVLPGVGISIGLTRLFDLALKNNLVSLTKHTEAEIFVGFREHSLKETAFLCAIELRKKGINTDLYSGTGNFKKQLNYAAKKGFESAVFVMDVKSIILKNLYEGNQIEVNNVNDLLNQF